MALPPRPLVQAAAQRYMGRSNTTCSGQPHLPHHSLQCTFPRTRSSTAQHHSTQRHMGGSSICNSAQPHHPYHSLQCTFPRTRSSTARISDGSHARIPTCGRPARTPPQPCSQPHTPQPPHARPPMAREHPHTLRSPAPPSSLFAWYHCRPNQHHPTSSHHTATTRSLLFYLHRHCPSLPHSSCSPFIRHHRLCPSHPPSSCSSFSRHHYPHTPRHTTAHARFTQHCSSPCTPHHSTACCPTHTLTQRCCTIPCSHCATVAPHCPTPSNSHCVSIAQHTWPCSGRCRCTERTERC